MKIDYNPILESQRIDLDQLRPNKSYDHLIENRNAALQSLMSSPDKLDEFLKTRSCPVCDGDQHSPQFVKDGLDIVQCSSCETIYVNPVFDDEKYQEIYQSEEYQEIVKRIGEDSHAYRKERFGTERAAAIEKFHDPALPKTFLEIGCSTGFVVEAAMENGWECQGIELNPSAAAFACERGLPVENVSIEKFSPEHKYSAIAFYDVLEHLVNPKGMLTHAVEHLNDNGCVFIYVPNYNSASRQLLGEQNAHFIWPTHHLTYFTPETLTTLLESVGLEVIHWETQGLDISDWLWFLEEKTGSDTALITDHMDALQFYINASGHGKNLRMYARKTP